MSQTEKYAKIVLVGDTSVGKTCLFRRLQDDPNLNIDDNSQHVSTIGVGIWKGRFSLLSGSGVDPIGRDQGVRIQLWDTAGHSTYRSFMTTYLREADVVLLCVDVTNRESVSHVSDWVKVIQEAGTAILIVLVGCKSDLLPNSGTIDEDRWVSVEMLYKVKEDQHGKVCSLAVTSARTGAGVASLRSLLAQMVMHGDQEVTKERVVSGKSLESANGQHGGCC